MTTEMSDAVRPHRAAKRWRIRARPWSWFIATQLAPFVLAFAVYLGAFLAMRPDTAGDEPHYLLVAESIAYDGDVDLVNDYASRERTLRVVNGFPLDPAPHAADYSGTGQLRPVHGVGLSALLAPAVAVGGLTGARIAMVLVAALLAEQLFRLLRDLRFRRRYRYPAWVAAVFCLPVLAFSSQIYPELPAALLLVVAFRIMVAGASSPSLLALGSTAGMAMVWLHVRYIPLSAGMFLGLAIAACSCFDLRNEAAHPRERGLLHGIRAAGAAAGRCASTLTRQWRTLALPLVAPYAIGLGIFAAAFQHWYGTPDPTAPYAAFSTTTAGSGGWRFLYDFFLGDLFNPIAGWIPFVPVHWLGLAALGCLVVKFRWRAVACLGVASGYELILASAGPNVGWGFPARYLIILIPLIAIPLAVVIQDVRAARIVFVPLLVLSLVFAVAAVDDYQGLYPIGEKPRIFGLRSTAAAFPNTRPPQLPTSFVLAPGQFGPQTGTVHGKVIVAKAGRDGPGFLLWGPYASLKDGTYRARFPLAVTGVRPDKPVATIEAAGAPPPKVFASKVVTAAELKPRFPSGVTLEFKTPGAYLTETRIYYQGHGTLRAGPIHVEREGGTAGGPPGRYPDWPLALIWVVGTAVAGWLLVRAMKRSAARKSSKPARAS
jgi:hypothetical protein